MPSNIICMEIRMSTIPMSLSIARMPLFPRNFMNRGARNRINEENAHAANTAPVTVHSWPSNCLAISMT